MNFKSTLILILYGEVVTEGRGAQPVALEFSRTHTGAWRPGAGEPQRIISFFVLNEIVPREKSFVNIHDN